MSRPRTIRLKDVEMRVLQTVRVPPITVQVHADDGNSCGHYDEIVVLDAGDDKFKLAERLRTLASVVSGTWRNEDIDGAIYVGIRRRPRQASASHELSEMKTSVPKKKKRSRRA